MSEPKYSVLIIRVRLSVRLFVCSNNTRELDGLNRGIHFLKAHSSEMFQYDRWLCRSFIYKVQQIWYWAALFSKRLRCSLMRNIHDKQLQRRVAGALKIIPCRFYTLSPTDLRFGTKTAHPSRRFTFEEGSKISTWKGSFLDVDYNIR